MINLGMIAAGGTIKGEVNFTDLTGNLNTLTGSPAFSLYAAGSSSAIASVTVSQVGSTNRYSFSVTDATGAGTYVIAATAGSVTSGNSIIGLVIAMFTVGTVPLPASGSMPETPHTNSYLTAAAPTAASIASAVWTLANAVYSSKTPAQALEKIIATLFGVCLDVGTSTEHFQDPGGGGAQVAVTYDSSNNRTGVTW